MDKPTSKEFAYKFQGIEAGARPILEMDFSKLSEMDRLNAGKELLNVSVLASELANEDPNLKAVTDDLLKSIHNFINTW